MFKLFKNKKSKESASIPPKNETESERKYFEVFGDSLNQIEFFKTLTLLLAGLCFFLLLTLKTTFKKPPLVIRVDQLGETQALRNVKSQSAVSAPEISNFTSYFLQYCTAWNYYTYETDLDRALQMSTQEYQQKLKDLIQNEQITQRIQKDQLKIKLTISEIIVENDTPKFTKVKVKGFREIRSYQNAGLVQEIIFESSLILKKVERTTKTPWGLLADNWSESLYKSK
jgi:type IV secretory pathway TrbF-like protein